MNKSITENFRLIGEFENDILHNLQEWDVRRDTIFYKTEKYGYRFRVEAGIVYPMFRIQGIKTNDSKWLAIYFL